MVEIVVSEISISFPFEPYPAQVELMRSVIRCLQGKANGLLESPTGTGKTLCLLCGTLGWLAATAPLTSTTGVVLRHNKPPLDASRTSVQRHKIVYCSRTHAQLTQVVRELKRTEYGKRFTMAVLGSREHMCVNSEVTRLPSSQAQQAMCSALRADRNCRFFRGLQSAPAGSSTLLSEEYAVHDMEDLVREGRKSGFCPYYHERDAAADADIVLMPYNYVLDPSLHKQLPFDLAGCVLIVDEAHNLPSVLSSAGCLNLSPLDLTTAIHDCSRAMAMQRLVAKKEEMEEEAIVAEEQELASLKILLSRLETCLYAEPLTSEMKDAAATPPPSSLSSANGQCDVVRSGAHMFEFLEKALITREVFGAGGDVEGGASGGLSGAMSKCVTLLTDSERPATSVVRVQEFLNAVFACDPLHLESTRFVLQQSLVANKPARTLGFWELDNTYLMRQVAAPLHCVLLTSGTLSPLDQFAAELGMEFEVQLKGSHVIQPEQVLGCVLCRGPSGEKLNGGFAFRSSVDYRVGLGMSLVNITRNTPGGTLVFFPSYASMNSTVDLWRAGSGRPGDTKTVWGLLSELKPIFVEPSNSSDLPTIVQGFQKEVDTAPQRGAILLAVCRGKISEGIDFADNHGRCVLVTGIPYANHTDLFVRLKRDYITAVAPSRPYVHGKPFTGDDWYRNEAIRAVNQCVGRVIRHKDDYGAVVFADERFEGLFAGISEWVRQRTRVFRDFRGAYATVAQFFAAYRHRATASAEVPYVVLEGKMEGAGVVPSSANLARDFAEALVRQREEQQEETRRRRLEEVREAKVTALPEAVSSPVSPFASVSFTTAAAARCAGARSNVGGATGGGGVLVTAPSSSSSREMPKASTSSVSASTISLSHAPSSADANGTSTGTTTEVTVVEPPKIGSTSKEFCDFLKERVPPEAYQRFKVVLARLAALRSVMRASPPTASEGVAKLVAPLKVIFSMADPTYYRIIFAEFGRHIPEELRPLYAGLLKQHQLT